MPPVQKRQLPTIPNQSAHTILKEIVDPDCQPTEKFPYVLTLKELELSQNEYIVILKNKNWVYTELNDGKQFDSDIDRQLTVNQQTLRSHQLEQYAKKFPLIKTYASLHTQEVTYPFNNIIMATIAKGGFDIVRKNYSTNVEITATSVFNITENNILMMMNLNSRPDEGKLISLPGCIQTVFELIHGPQPALKLKTIKTSNKTLQNLILKNFESIDSQILEALVNQAKKEESMELLYGWYKKQAKIFLSDRFYRDYNPPLDCDAFVKEFLLEVKIFLENYSEPKAKYREFIADISEFFSRQVPDQDNVLIGHDNYDAEMTYSIRHQFFLRLYGLIKKEKAMGTIPLPLPMVGLDVDANLYIIIPREAVVFISTFREYNNKLFNEVFNANDEEGNFMALFNHYSELKRFLVNCKMNESSAKLLVFNLHNELCQEEQWQKLLVAKTDWQILMDELASMFNLVAPSKEVTDKLFKNSPEGKKILEENWRNDLAKIHHDIQISGPLMAGNGFHKASLIDILKTKINFRYYKCCTSINLDKQGLTLILKCSVPVEMLNNIKHYSSVKYFDEGFRVMIKDHREISQFVENLKVNSEALYAEIKLDLNESGSDEESCLLM
jgi:hypothetical protein